MRSKYLVDVQTYLSSHVQSISSDSLWNDSISANDFDDTAPPQFHSIIMADDDDSDSSEDFPTEALTVVSASQAHYVGKQNDKKILVFMLLGQGTEFEINAEVSNRIVTRSEPSEYLT